MNHFNFLVHPNEIELLICLIISITFILYLFLIYKFLKGWNKLNKFEVSKRINSALPLSCIIPFRNEIENIPKLIESLKQQDYPNFEVILVNDHSSDGSEELALSLINDLNNFKLLSNIGEGKKAALFEGVKRSQFDHLVFTDADCTHNLNWISSIAQIISKNNIDLLVGPVKLMQPQNYFERFQEFDFISLISSSAGAIGNGHPIMCNAANLSVSKSIWYEANKIINNNYASGDDIFLLQYCIAQKKVIEFINSPLAVVTTTPETNFFSFFSQRVRWAAKSKGYTDSYTLFVAWVVFICNLFIFISPILILTYPLTGILLMFLWINKMIFDYWLISKGKKLFNVKLNLLHYLWISLLYPFYIISTVIYAAFGSTNWKGRKI